MALLTVIEACKMLRCSRSTLYNLRDAGKIKMLRLGYRTSRVVKQSVERLIREHDGPIGLGGP